ncbi:MAG: GNAT family N-acetyltransferase [Butyrivibrio sp.]|nr:GNAT family N-acetyltransferase [Butyrivibrio sp.]
MILETRRLILRGWRDEDAPGLFKYAKDERVGPAAGWLPHTDVRYSRAVIRTILSKEEVYCICLKGNRNEPIGSIGLTLEGSSERPLDEGTAELGYWLGVPFWGQGIASEAAGEIIRHGFDDLALKGIFCAYFMGNERSRRVMFKCGFKHHHTNLESKIPMLGETRVEYFNYLSFEEWKCNKTKFL